MSYTENDFGGGQMQNMWQLADIMQQVLAALGGGGGTIAVDISSIKIVGIDADTNHTNVQSWLSGAGAAANVKYITDAYSTDEGLVTTIYYTGIL